MTREEAQELLATTGGKLVMEKLQAVNFIFNELDELKMMEEDAQQYALKCRKELEALQSRSCDRCLHRSELHEALMNGTNNGFCVENGFFTKRGFCCNRYEPKEQ